MINILLILTLEELYLNINELKSLDRIRIIIQKTKIVLLMMILQNKILKYYLKKYMIYLILENY